VADLEVRPSSDADIERVELLIADGLARLHTLRGGGALLETLGVGDDASPAALARAVCAGPRDDVLGYVAVLEAAVVGVAVAVREPRCLTVVGVHVARSLRRRRIGSALIDALGGVASTEGVRLEAVALPGDQTTKSMFEAAGFRARLLRLSVER